jgi:hypothetical protein
MLRTDKLTAICEPIASTMCDPQQLITLMPPWPVRRIAFVLYTRKPFQAISLINVGLVFYVVKAVSPGLEGRQFFVQEWPANTTQQLLIVETETATEMSDTSFILTRQASLYEYHDPTITKFPLFQSVLQCLQFISQFLLPPKAHGFGYE